MRQAIPYRIAASLALAGLLHALPSGAQAKEAKDSTQVIVPAVVGKAVVLAKYPAGTDGLTFQVERGTCAGDHDHDCNVYVRLMKGRREVNRESCSGGNVGAGKLVKLEADSWGFQDIRDDLEYSTVTVKPFQPASGMTGLRCEVTGSDGCGLAPSYYFRELAVVAGKVKTIWDSEEPGNHDAASFASVESRGGGSPEFVFQGEAHREGDEEYSVAHYSIHTWSPEKGRMKEIRPLYAVKIGNASKSEAADALLDPKCKGFADGEDKKSIVWVNGPSFPALRTSARLVVAITSSESQAKDWQQKLQECRGGKAVKILQLK
jgi:hypothetical protein